MIRGTSLTSAVLDEGTENISEKVSHHKTDSVSSTDRGGHENDGLLNVGVVFYASLILVNVAVCKQDSLRT
jgi:hypothetical protein